MKGEERVMILAKTSHDCSREAYLTRRWSRAGQEASSSLGLQMDFARPVFKRCWAEDQSSWARDVEWQIAIQAGESKFSFFD